MRDESVFAYLDCVAAEYGVPAENLVRIFELERNFHTTILATENAADRKRQYFDVYEQVHRLKQYSGAAGGEGGGGIYGKLVRCFHRELEAKSVLDVGCGSGAFLIQIARRLKHGELWGVDTSEVNESSRKEEFRFVQADVISFDLERSFDVVFSHQVLEHIAPMDVAEHLRSIHAALRPGGTFIVLLPNRYWGPHDITRIVDNTFSGRVPAAGSHLNESCYTDLIPMIEAAGFGAIRTTLPLAVHLPALSGIRVKPTFNLFVEKHTSFRKMLNLVRVKGAPVFKSPVTLISQKRG